MVHDPRNSQGSLSVLEKQSLQAAVRMRLWTAQHNFQEALPMAVQCTTRQNRVLLTTFSVEQASPHKETPRNLGFLGLATRTQVLTTQLQQDSPTHHVAIWWGLIARTLAHSAHRGTTAPEGAQYTCLSTNTQPQHLPIAHASCTCAARCSPQTRAHHHKAHHQPHPDRVQCSQGPECTRLRSGCALQRTCCRCEHSSPQARGRGTC